MKSHIPFLQTPQTAPFPSDQALTIFTSSAALGWDGIQLEHGEARLFLPDLVSIPRHYIAMLLSEPFTWECKQGQDFKTVTTYQGQICSIYPAHTTISHRVTRYNEFVSLTLEPETVTAAVEEMRGSVGREFVCRHNLDDPQLQGLIRLLLAEARAGNPNGKLFVESLTTALAVHFATHYSVERTAAPLYRSGLSSRQFQRVSDYIEAHLAEEISLDALAKEAGLSKYHFIRLFKQSTGLTPHQYLVRRRLHSARNLLKRQEFSLIEIANQSGFSDQSHFTRLFKQRYGVTPGAFQSGKTR